MADSSKGLAKPSNRFSIDDEIENRDANAIYRDDRFSALPDEVIHRILSPLPFSDVIRVGSLSKRCGQVCSSIPTLNFSEFPSDSTATFDKRLELLASLDSFFSQRDCNDKVQLQTLNINWEFPYRQFKWQVTIPNWREHEARQVCASIRKAVGCRVENLSVFAGGRDPAAISFEANAGWLLGGPEPLEFPCCVLSSRFLKSIDFEMFGTIINARSFSTCIISNLVRLRLKNVMMEDGEGFCKWVSSACRFIKELLLEDVARLQNITIESSSLESFQLRSALGWHPLRHLHISAEKLEHICIACTTQERKSTPMEIFAPNLRYLSLYWRGDTTINLRSPGELNYLEKAELELVNIKHRVDTDSSTSHDQLVLSRVLQSVKVLTLRDLWAITTPSKEGCTGPPLHNVRCLRISTWICYEFDNNLVPTVASLFRRLPNLNTLEIYVSYLFGIPKHRFDRRYWQLQNLDFISQLKDVTLEVPEGSNDSNLIEFARYVLEHAQNLKKMVVICEPSESRLISLIRSSMSISNASVVFLENGSKKSRSVGPGKEHHHI
ncbi:unnamed protein product [Malus baccata var. baccata]